MEPRHIDIERLLDLQRKLFEKAHEQPIELKGIGMALRRQGIDTTKFYCNPRFLPLPWTSDATLGALTQEQLSVLSAVFFGTAYAEIATSETLALRYNMVTSELVFPLYSDNYMVLFHETAEEYDHIIAFRSLCKGFLGDGELIGPDRFERLAPVYRTYDLYKGRLSKEGFGALYLLTRYLLNLALKQLEGFMGKGVPSERQDPLAMELVAGHAADEARHFTTSLDLGLALFRKAEPESRRKVAGILRTGIYRMIEERFDTDPRKTWHYQAACGALRVAMERPEFASVGATYDTLAEHWRTASASHDLDDSFVASRRWMASQLRHLADALETKLTPAGEAYEHFVDHLGARARELRAS